ncbi:hypothetical protein ACFYO7_14250 [Nocardia salmonicida]|uniref:hypothetical protein n=1 Tax=Nocardia salmonicida TaxID=53431 RepID=UPI0036AC17F4
MSRREDLYLADIVTAYYRIASYLENLTFADFQKDDLRQDGVIPPAFDHRRSRVVAGPGNP